MEDLPGLEKVVLNLLSSLTLNELHLPSLTLFTFCPVLKV